MANDFQRPQRLILGGLWENQTREGVVWYSGTLNNLRITIWPVKSRKTDKHPTHTIFVEEQQPREAKPAESGGTIADEDLPF
jgi:hypothetical protein